MRSRLALALGLLLSASQLTGCGNRTQTAQPAPVEIDWPDAAVVQAAPGSDSVGAEGSAGPAPLPYAADAGL